MEQPSLFDLPAAERARNLGIARAGESVRAWPWREHARDTIRQLAETGRPFTSDDVVAVVGLPDVGPNRNNAVGAVFQSAARAGLIVKTGSYRKATRVVSHARMLAVWIGNPDVFP